MTVTAIQYSAALVKPPPASQLTGLCNTWPATDGQHQADGVRDIRGGQQEGGRNNRAACNGCHLGGDADRLSVPQRSVMSRTQQAPSQQQLEHPKLRNYTGTVPDVIT